MASTSAPASASSSSPAAPQSVSAQKPPAPEPELTENYPSFHGLTGRSPVMRQLILQMQRIAPNLTLATLEGQEGTGRTLAARALHAVGPAAQGPFVPCLATHFFSPGPVTEEIDGHCVRRAPILRQAHGGTLFLDRVHQLSTEQQERLAEFLRWFDDLRFHSLHDAKADDESDLPDRPNGFLPIQIFFSTSMPLRNSGFREDLASRLSAVRFRLPPLTERREDIPLLAQVFIQRFARAYGKAVRGLGPGTIAPLLRYAWPGNVRELEETIAAAALDTESQWIRPIDLPPLSMGKRDTLSGAGTGFSETAPDCKCNLDCAIRGHVTRVLHRTRGNKLRAAQLLGISR